MKEETRGPRTGDILVGVFLILFGCCITLVGGVCTLIWGSLVLEGASSAYGGGALGLVLSLVSIAAVAGGLLSIVNGARIARGRRGNEAAGRPPGGTDDAPPP